ncbi:MAG: penicillin-binding protein [Micromonosporaceae bacterium]|nr:penicillin-binding protein [Micromonosporaceae bacterium]
MPRNSRLGAPGGHAGSGLTAVLAMAGLLLGSLTACSGQEGPENSITAFLTGWTQGQFDPNLQIIDANGGPVSGTEVAAAIKTLEGGLAPRKPKLTPEKAKVSKDQATVAIDVSWQIADGATWSYQSSMPLQLKEKKWRPVWSPSVVQPDLKDGDKISVRSTPATRGDILDGKGAPIVSQQPVVYIGVQPNAVTDVNALVAALDRAFKSIGKQVGLTDLPSRIQQAGPTSFVDIVVLRDSDYQQIRAQIHPLPGMRFRTGTLPLAPTTTFARAVLGSVGAVTKERMDAHPGKYVASDQVGFGGLQEQYDDRLRGKPGISVVIPGAQGEADKFLYQVKPTNGQTVQTSLDVRTQNAAEKALAGEPKRAAIVAIRISDGAILALANGPGAAPLDLALSARVPPGSTFKTVTATSLLDAGKITVNTPVQCSQTLVVNGYTIHNSDGEQLGTFPLHIDFAHSCNTAFARLAPQLGPTGLRDTGTQLGLGVAWDLGLSAFSGSVSANGDATEQAAAAFGQGRTVVSPVAMAALAAAVSRGQWKQPRLVLDPAPANPAPDQPALKPATVAALKQMMREVVTGGTATKVKSVPGAPIYGKTGTAEYDNNPAHTHSWFIGFRGDIAFAVFVENGGLSSTKAVPIAGAFFRNLG